MPTRKTSASTPGSAKPPVRKQAPARTRASTSASKTTSSAAAGTCAAAKSEVSENASAPDRAAENAELKKRELVEQIVRRTGQKKRDVRPTVEAMLDVLGDAFREGRDVNLQPLGKTKLNRVKHLPGAQVSVIRLRQRKSPV